MGLENDDIEKIGMILSLRLTEAMKPIEELLQKHTYILTGADGDNGVCSDTKQLKKDVSEVKNDITKFKAYAVAISGGISTLFVIGRELFDRVTGK